MAAKPGGDIDDIWLMRPCEVYKEEHNDCKTLFRKNVLLLRTGTNKNLQRKDSIISYGIWLQIIITIPGLLSRFYQYYVNGAMADCSPWMEDYKNCMEFRKKKNKEAADAVIASEKLRRKQRLSNAKANNVWEYRTSPPEEWFTPLGNCQNGKDGTR